MTRLERIEMDVLSLSEDDYREFRRWFLERDWDEWDREVEEDSLSGRLDFLANEALSAKSEGKLRAL